MGPLSGDYGSRKNNLNTVELSIHGHWTHFIAQYTDVGHICYWVQSSTQGRFNQGHTWQDTLIGDSSTTDSVGRDQCVTGRQLAGYRLARPWQNWLYSRWLGCSRLASNSLYSFSKAWLLNTGTSMSDLALALFPGLCSVHNLQCKITLAHFIMWYQGRDESNVSVN